MMDACLGSHERRQAKEETTWPVEGAVLTEGQLGRCWTGLNAAMREVYPRNIDWGKNIWDTPKGGQGRRRICRASPQRV